MHFIEGTAAQQARFQQATKRIEPTVVSLSPPPVGDADSIAGSPEGDSKKV